MEAPIGFEPMIRVLQTRALPLGYGAIIYKQKNGAGNESRTRDQSLARIYFTAKLYLHKKYIILKLLSFSISRANPIN